MSVTCDHLLPLWDPRELVTTPYVSYAIVGPPASGKTYLARTLLAVIAPTRACVLTPDEASVRKAMEEFIDGGANLIIPNNSLHIGSAARMTATDLHCLVLDNCMRVVDVKSGPTRVITQFVSSVYIWTDNQPHIMLLFWNPVLGERQYLWREWFFHILSFERFQDMWKTQCDRNPYACLVYDLRSSTLSYFVAPMVHPYSLLAPSNVVKMMLEERGLLPPLVNLILAFFDRIHIASCLMVSKTLLVN